MLADTYRLVFKTHAYHWNVEGPLFHAVHVLTEGQYEDMFAAADLMLLNKVDLLPHLSFDVARAEEFARRVNPGLQMIRISATSGEGFDRWLDWIRQGAERAVRGNTPLAAVGLAGA